MDDEPFYPVAEIAARLGPKSERQRDLWLRRLRHWSLTGVLDPVGRRHTGTGHHRLYNTETLHIAAVLMRLADLGVPLGPLKVIAGGLAKNKDHSQAAERWEAAKRPAQDGCWWICFLFSPSDHDAFDTVSVAIEQGDGLMTPAIWAEVDAPIFVNLTSVFSRVKP